MFLLRTPASKASELVITTDGVQNLLVVMNKAVQNKQLPTHNGKVPTYTITIMVHI